VVLWLLFDFILSYLVLRLGLITSSTNYSCSLSYFTTPSTYCTTLWLDWAGDGIFKGTILKVSSVLLVTNDYLQLLIWFKGDSGFGLYCMLYYLSIRLSSLYMDWSIMATEFSLDFLWDMNLLYSYWIWLY
jgi:hypothetical protein